MDELAAQLARILADGPHKLVLSAPRDKAAHRRATLVAAEGGWRLERLTPTQAFHKEVAGEDLPGVLEGLLREDFTQLHAFAPGREWRLRLSKKGKVLVSQSALPETAPPPPAGHDREKNYLLPQGVPIAPLVDMGIFTPEGQVARRMHDKYRQVMRFLELVDDSLDPGERGPLRVVDFGCGKSTLTFVLYYYLTVTRGMAVEMVGLDLKADVVAKCNAAAGKYGYDHLRFEVGDIAGYQSGEGADLVVSLHACDTATDEALARAAAWGAKRIFAVPCCQHELNGQLHSEALPLLERYGIIKERTAALMTDAIRANLLSACGYKTLVLEFVDLAHTPKNLLLRAQKATVPPAARKKALREVRELCAAFSLEPTLLRLLVSEDLLPE